MSDNIRKLEKALDVPLDESVDFECDMCEQRYYDSDDVEAESLYYDSQTGTQYLRAEATFPKTDGWRMNSGGAPVIHGYDANEIMALLKALTSSECFEFTTEVRVVDHEPAFVDDPSDVTPLAESIKYDNDVVGAIVKATIDEPDRSPDVLVCEYCKKQLDNE